MRPIATLLLGAGLLSAADDAIAAPGITLIPERVEQLGDLRFDEQGRPVSESRVLTVTLRPQVPAGLTVVGWGQPRLDSAVASNGDALALAPEVAEDEPMAFNGRVVRINNRLVQFGNHRMGNMLMDGDASAPPSLVIRLAPPERPAFSIARLAGTVPVTWRTGPTEDAAYKPLSDQPIDKPMPVPGVPGGTLTIVAREAQQVVLRWSDEVEARMAGVRFEDAAGGALPTRGSGTSSRNGVIDRSYRVALPDGGAVVLLLHPESHTADLPLLIEQMPLPGSDAVPPAGSP